jgi:hypothetical protein
VQAVYTAVAYSVYGTERRRAAARRGTGGTGVAAAAMCEPVRASPVRCCRLRSAGRLRRRRGHGDAATAARRGRRIERRASC